MFGSLLGWREWLAIYADYLWALALIAAGIYLAFGLAPPTGSLWSKLLKPLRWIGYGLMIIGIALAAVTYGRSLGAAECEAAWKEKNYEARIARLEQERDAKNVAADATATSLKQLATEKEEADGKVAEYQTDIARLSNEVAACRRATADDDRRMCQILGASAAGCRNSR